MRKKRRPDYRKLYPGLEIEKDVLDFLRKSDMQMEYAEQRRKKRRTAKDKRGNYVKLPSLEDSLDRLTESCCQFVSLGKSPEELMVKEAEHEHVRSCVAALDQSDKELVWALFYERLTESAYARILGISQPAVSARKASALAKLKKFLESTDFWL